MDREPRPFCSWSHGIQGSRSMRFRKKVWIRTSTLVIPGSNEPRFGIWPLLSYVQIAVILPSWPSAKWESNLYSRAKFSVWVRIWALLMCFRSLSFDLYTTSSLSVSVQCRFLAAQVMREWLVAWPEWALNPSRSYTTRFPLYGECKAQMIWRYLLFDWLAPKMWGGRLADRFSDLEQTWYFK